MNRQLIDDVTSAFDEANADDETRAIIFTGAGRAFCAGDDRKEHTHPESEAEARDLVQAIQRATEAIVLGPKPVVGAINGWAVGGGFEWAINCDFPIWAASARGFFPEVSLNIFVTGAVTSLLPALVGLNRGPGDAVPRRRVRRRGPARAGCRVAGRARTSELLAEAHAVAARLAALPALAARAMKRVLNEGAVTDIRARAGRRDGGHGGRHARSRDHPPHAVRLLSLAAARPARHARLPADHGDPVRLHHRGRRLGRLRAGQPAQRRPVHVRPRPRGRPARLAVGRVHPHARRAVVPDRQQALRLAVRVRARAAHARPAGLPRQGQGARRVEQHQRDDLPAGQPAGLRALGRRPGHGDVGLRPLPAVLQADGDAAWPAATSTAGPTARWCWSGGRPRRRCSARSSRPSSRPATR